MDAHIIKICTQEGRALAPRFTELGTGLIAFAKARLARYKAPHWIRFETDPLPRNDRDKIDRKRLRARDS